MSWTVIEKAGGPALMEVQGALRQPGEWFPCDRPEAAWDDDTALHDCCRACLVATVAEFQINASVRADAIERMRWRLDEYGPAPHLADFVDAWPVSSGTEPA